MGVRIEVELLECGTWSVRSIDVPHIVITGSDCLELCDRVIVAIADYIDATQIGVADEVV